LLYHVLLVDDEIHAVRGVKAGMNWERLKVSTVYTAHNLRQAQMVFQSNPVDIMVCDIEMPGGSGMELLGWVREHFPETIAIFLSCHADFGYAKQALQLKSFDYLLKPVDYLELESVISRALSMLQEEKTAKEKFWVDLINEAIPTEFIQTELIKRKLKFNEAQYYVPILFRVQSWDPSLSKQDIKLIEFAMKNVIEEKMPSISMSLSQDDFFVMATVETPKTLKEILLNCESFLDFFHESFSVELCGYVGESVALTDVVSMVKALQNNSKDNVSLSRHVFSLKDIAKQTVSIPDVPWDDWKVWLKEGAKQQLMNDIKSFFDKWKEEERVSVYMLHRFYENFLQMLLHVLKVKGLQSHDVFTSSILTEENNKIFKSFFCFQGWVLRVTHIAADHIQSLTQKSSVVETVKELIHENIGMQQLSREWLANAVYLHPDYISRLFKKETGLLISEYLQQQRIEYAKQLLSQTKKSVTDIALAVGYSNISYFSTTFKKLMQMGPIEFRKRYQKV
jgi:two-component system, response regulator YesN